MNSCTIPDCGRPYEARGFCVRHYKRWKRHGDPRAGQAQHGALLRYFEDVVLAYDGDDCLIWPFSKGGRGYALMDADGRKQIVSRLVCIKAYGPPPTPKHYAAHSCGNGHLACVAKRHLRWATPKENSADKIIHATFGRRSL